MKLTAADKKLVKELTQASLTQGSIDADKVHVVIGLMERLAPSKLVYLLKAYRKQLSVIEKSQQALVESTEELSLKQKEQLESELSKHTQVRQFLYQIKPDILGGIRITCGDTLLDYSLLYKFESLTNT